MDNNAIELGIFNASVLKVTGVTKSKSNGGKSRTCIVNIKDGMFAGLETFANRTILNGKGNVKPEVEEGEDVKVQVSYFSAEQSTSGKEVYFFELYKEGENEGSTHDIASTDTLSAMRAKAELASQKA